MEDPHFPAFGFNMDAKNENEKKDSEESKSSLKDKLGKLNPFQKSSDENDDDSEAPSLKDKLGKINPFNRNSNEDDDDDDKKDA